MTAGNLAMGREVHRGMRSLTLFVAVLCGLVLAGCQTNRRIQERSAAFAQLDPATQRDVRAGTVRPGFTSDMVYMAMGNPAARERDSAGNPVWVYHREPIPGPNETLIGGFRQRRVYDPERRGETVIIEPIDTKAFPNLARQTWRLTFVNDRVSTIDRLVGR